MFSSLAEFDRNLFWVINSINSPFWDQVMIAITGKWIWLPFYVALAVWLYYNLQQRALTLILFALIGLGLSDAVSSHFFKPFFERLRPCHVLSFAPYIHTPDGCGGEYGFVSSHAANTFALAFFLWIILRKHLKGVRWLFLWAAIVSYSRIYLGKHYPGDVVGGAMVGMFSAFIMYRIYTYFALRAGLTWGKWWFRKWMEVSF